MWQGIHQTDRPPNVHQDFGTPQRHKTGELVTAVAERSTETKQSTDFDRTKVVSNIQTFCSHITREAIKITRITPKPLMIMMMIMMIFHHLMP
jgi:hypothetical protein